MKKFVFVLALFVCWSAATFAAPTGKTKIFGDEAKTFVAEEFPEASVPGTFQGFFKYDEKKKTYKIGYANCFVPAELPLGAAPDGSQADCCINWNVVVLKGLDAEKFIRTNFPNAMLPGAIEGSFNYDDFGIEKSGYAECISPAMGAQSEGAVTSCSVSY